ncbi:sporulation protein YabP [Hazenella coriacea]|nr:sporulation protein YabP [Hazenella coriacea]
MVEETVSNQNNQHEIILTNRNSLEVTGVVSVESFDSEEFLLQTEYGFLGIRGQELHIKSLDLDQGRVAIEGHFIDFSYLDLSMPRTEKTKNLLGRLFR